MAGNANKVIFCIPGQGGVRLRNCDTYIQKHPTALGRLRYFLYMKNLIAPSYCYIIIHT